jgi:flagellar biosynthesis/type III secretory pathway protein FliH
MSLEELKKDKRLLQILSVDTLETRQSDQLDFHELSVHQLVDAIEYAYEDGYENGRESGKEDGYFTGFDVGYDMGLEA